MNKKVDKDFKYIHDKYLLQCICTEMKNKIEQLYSNWNSLREYCEENKYFYSGFQGEDREEDLSIKYVLDKMNELESCDIK